MEDEILKPNKVTWDYTSLAEAYLSRPQYADKVFETVIQRVNLEPKDRIADIGAGTGNCAIQFLSRGFFVDAIEPNNEMRKLGIQHTKNYRANIAWFNATGEVTQRPYNTYKLVTFGSSFNVLNQQKALREAANIMLPDGWFMCCWNHRDINTPLQKDIEKTITKYLPNYNKGVRAEDQAEVIEASGLFHPAESIVSSVIHHMRTDDWIDAWKSHATLARQAGDKFEIIVSDIAKMLSGQNQVEVPYITKSWLAQRIDKN